MEINLYDVLRRPIISEKATMLGEELNQYTFEVDMRANKIQIRDAVDLMFYVNVERVNTMIMPPKRGRRGRRIYIRKKKWKKAIVTIRDGQTIPLFDQ